MSRVIDKNSRYSEYNDYLQPKKDFNPKNINDDNLYYSWEIEDSKKSNRKDLFK